jgi:hypothetical protein
MDLKKLDVGRSEYNVLLDGIFPVAQKLLLEHGEFYPFAGALSQEGKVLLKTTESDEEHPDPGRLHNELLATLRRDSPRKNFVAFVICVNVNIASSQQPEDVYGEGDAIQFSFETANGEAIDLFLPYASPEDQSGLSYGRPILSKPNDKRSLQ